MLSAKIVTCLLGLALLIPLTVTFGIMAVRHQRSEAEMQKSLAEAMATLRAEIDSEMTPGFIGAAAGNVRITDQIGLPYVSYRLWSPFPRRWVGIVGLVCCLVISSLWIYSAFAPTMMVSGEYGRESAQPDFPNGEHFTIENPGPNGPWEVPSDTKK